MIHDGSVSWIAPRVWPRYGKSCFALPIRPDPPAASTTTPNVDTCDPLRPLRALERQRDHDDHDRHRVVPTFLAVLEMAKLNLIRVHQPHPHGEIYLSRTDTLLDTSGEGVQVDYRG